jgi:amino-acid N-acetyltransferase
MSGKDHEVVQYGPASADDLGGIRALLTHVHLPSQDVGAPNQTFVVARAGGELVGCVALEQYGGDALLRSLAVIPRLQSTGIGKALYAKAVDGAAESGTCVLYLLTTTAAPFFAKVGFTQIDRAEVPIAIRESPEFRSLCPASAVCMMRALR